MSNIKYFSGIENMPTPLLRIDTLVNRLADGKNIIYMVYESMVSNLSQKIAHLCEEKGFMVRFCNVPDIDDTPRQYFLQMTGITNDSLLETVPVNKILMSPECPNVVILHGLESIHAESRQLWISFVNEWLRHSKNYVCHGWDKKALLLLMEDSSLLENICSEPGWDVNWYWNWITKTETNIVLLCLLLGSNIMERWKPWLEAILSELAGPDLDLLEWLCQSYVQMTDSESILNLLCSYSEKKGFLSEANKTDFRKYHGSAVNGNETPPENLYRLWEKGIVNYTPEEGLFFHSAFLAAVDEKQTILHRLWRGMARYLFPLIDQARIKLCTAFSRKYTDEWKDHCKREKEHDEQLYGNTCAIKDKDRESIFTELRGILSFLYQKGYTYNNRYSRLYDEVKRLRDSRNVLAHGSLLDREEFMKTLEAALYVQDLNL